jgi:CBS domain containing-hemolysin-like protein
MRKKEPFNIRNIIRPIHIVPETKHIGQLLNEFQIRHQQIALVVNEYGGTEGLITMEDILEELVGEIQDEYDNEIPFVEKIGEKTFNVMASATIDDVNDLLPHPLEKNEQYETLAGYLILKFGRIPNVKEKISVDNYEFCIIKKNRSTLVLVQLIDLMDKKI